MENNLIGDDEQLIDVKKKISKGVTVLLIREFFLKLFAFAGQIILARILFPSQFGTIAIIAFIINFFTLFLDIGLSPAIIREKKKPSQKQLSTIFFTKIGLTFLTLIVLFVSAPFFIKYINGFDQENLLMIYVYSGTLIFTSLKSIPVAIIERELKYDLVSGIDIAGVVAYQISVVLLAVAGLGVWSFIFANYIKDILETIMIYKISPWRPNLYFDRNKIQHIMHFGIYMQAGGLINYFQNSIIPVIGGFMTTPYHVGLLDWAYSIAFIPETITNNFGRVAYSGFSKMQHNKLELTRSISKSIKILTILNIYFVVIIFGFGKEIVELVYTSKWLPGIYALYWFAAALIFTPFISVYAQGIFALGKSKIYFKFNLICAVIEWALAYMFVIRYGFEGIAVSYFVFCLILSLSSYLIARKIGIGSGIIKNLKPLIIYLPVSMIFVTLLNQIITLGFIGLVIKVSIISIVYVLLTSLLANEEFNFFIKEIKLMIHAKSL